MALNSARASLGTPGSLNATAFAAAVGQLQSAFNLPSAFNMVATACYQEVVGAGWGSATSMMVARLKAER